MKSDQYIKQAIDILSDLGEHQLIDDLLCAYAALNDCEHPRIDMTYSSTMRKLRQKNKSKVHEFQKTFKSAFEDALNADLENPSQLAMMYCIQNMDLDA